MEAPTIPTLRSLGWHTDMFFLRHTAQVEDRGAYIAIRSPDNPTFHWGNFLLYREPPRPGDVHAWREAFASEFPGSESSHETFGWDVTGDEVGAAQEFGDAGFELEREVVLRADASTLVAPRHPCPDLVVRPVQGDEEWELVLQSQLEPPLPVGDAASYEIFLRAQLAAARRLCEQGSATWIGGFLEGELAGSLGVLWSGALARYRSVTTTTRFRRRGVGQTLVHAAGEWALRETSADALVIVAEEDDPEFRARQLYESLGFERVELQLGLSRSPGSPAGD